MAVSPALADQLIDLVRAVGRDEIMPRFRNLGADGIETKSDLTDLVTIADRAAEARITEEISRLMPSVVIIGEEAAFADPALTDKLRSADLVVLVDPIDGTWNFAGGLPVFGVMIAVVEAGRTSFGLLYDPVTDSWVYASAGKGVIRAEASGRQQVVRLDPDKPTSAGFLPLWQFDPATRLALLPRIADLSRISSLSCSCHEYWLLSHGAADFGLSALLNPWDHAAGELIYREAGGFSAMLDGSPYRPGHSKGHLLVARSQAHWVAMQNRIADLQLQILT